MKNYDYSQQNLYFVTISVNEMKHVFGEIVDFKVQLNKKGKIIEEIIKDYNIDKVKIDTYVIMPNHIHLIFQFEEKINKTLSQIVSMFKSKCTYKLQEKNLWKRNYYERVIRDQNEYDNVVQYILDNPYRDKYKW